jgi:outer membrane protein OmpA-like peptidoglycan-associated protein
MDMASAQDPTFTPFKGIVYDMPVIEHYFGKIKRNDFMDFYSDTVYSYEVLHEIELKKINIPETDIGDRGFPGVNKRTKFAMILHSGMTIEKEGCYEFTLTSDDGSRLWINDRQVVNNDGGHQIESQTDTIGLAPGTYDAKLWYFQGMPYRFAFIFKSRLLPPEVKCDSLVAGNISWPNVHFELNSFDLNQEAMAAIDSIASLIFQGDFHDVEVIGHADHTGAEATNYTLSVQRAHAVAEALKERLNGMSIHFKTSGMGSSQPLQKDSKEDNQWKNRRVEVKW